MHPLDRQGGASGSQDPDQNDAHAGADAGPGATPPAQERCPAPYRDAAWTYRGAGWVGVLPIPYRSKALRAAGWTGHTGAWPSAADVAAWAESDRPDEGGGNVALRLPPDVVGIDVDAYAGKTGAADLADAVHRWGPLPDTWGSTARDDGISGIRFFRVPEGLRWPGQVGPGIEIIQFAHRYAVVWPSMHPEGRVYRWYRPDGMASLAPPRVDELPDLPDPWIAGLTGGELAEQVRIADLSSGEVGSWLTAVPGGPPCRAMSTVTERLLTELRTGSAHESLRRLVGLVRLAEQGHAGLAVVLTQVHQAFMAEATNPSRSGSARDDAAAQSEWSRSLGGAVRRVLGAPSVADEAPSDPCASPFAGLLARADGLGPAERPALVSPTLPDAPAASPGPAPQAPAPGPTGTPAGPADPWDEYDRRRQHDSGDDSGGPGAPGAHADPGGQQHGHQDAQELGQGGDGQPDGTGTTSWWPRDLTAILAGEKTEPEPSVLARDDGACLYYRGKINALLGESESGKTWILLQAVKEQIEANESVLYLDFEDTADSVVARLLAMGVAAEQLHPSAGLFAYIGPDEALHALAAVDLATVLAGRTYSLIGLDGVNAAMTLLGLDLSSNPDATKFAQTLLRPLARTGAAVVTVDHVGKDKEARGKGGIGAQAKRAMITGCSIAVDVLAPFGRGNTGKLRLTVDKDRPGHVRGFAENSKNVGVAVLESGSNGSVRVRIDPPGSVAATQPTREPFRPTAIMEKISRFLSTTEGMLSGKQIEDAVPGRAAIIRLALDALVEDGYITRHAGPRNAVLHQYERTFREVDELAGQGPGSDERDDQASEW